MNLIGQAGGRWKYQLENNEAAVLCGLVRRFPVTRPFPARISRANADHDRQKLLKESLAEHRKELKLMAADLLANHQWRKTGDGLVLTLSAGERETLLQILNDIRIGCWHAIGEPDEVEAPPDASRQEVTYRHWMDLAGYFEMNLVEPEVEER